MQSRAVEALGQLRLGASTHLRRQVVGPLVGELGDGQEVVRGMRDGIGGRAGSGHVLRQTAVAKTRFPRATVRSMAIIASPGDGAPTVAGRTARDRRRPSTRTGRAAASDRCPWTPGASALGAAAIAVGRARTTEAVDGRTRRLELQ